MGNSNTTKHKIVKKVQGYAVRVRFDEIQTLESIITRRPTEKYILFSETVRKHKVTAVIESYPYMICLFDNENEAFNVEKELKDKLDTIEKSDGILVFEPKDSKETKKDENTDA